MWATLCLIAMLALLCISCATGTQSPGHGSPIGSVKSVKSIKATSFVVKSEVYNKNTDKKSPVETQETVAQLSHEEIVRKWYEDNPEFAPKKFKGKKIEQKSGKTAKKEKQHFAVEGWALTSWYGPGFDGNPMAWGEIFDMTDPTIVAHKTLPKNTKLKLTNPSTGKTITVRVADHGPYHGNRELDLSWAAAEELGMVEQGVAWLKVEKIS